MKHTSTTPLPDSMSLVPELKMHDTWDARSVSDLIRSKCRFGETPAFLFVGKKEADLLRGHLAEVFGAWRPRAVSSAHHCSVPSM